MPGTVKPIRSKEQRWQNLSEPAVPVAKNNRNLHCSDLSGEMNNRILIPAVMPAVGGHIAAAMKYAFTGL
jgi:hypothetical protein